MKRICLIATVGGLNMFMVLTDAPPAHATVRDYHNHVQGLSETILQYDFDGNTDMERRQDKAGSIDLVESKPSGAAISYGVAGFDFTSKAYTPAYNNALITVSKLKLPEAGVSFDGIVKLDLWEEYGTPYVVGANASGRRSYFCMQLGKWRARGGSGGTWAPLISSSETQSGHWYYVATTMYYDSVGDVSVVNTYSADLSVASPTLEHVATDSYNTGSFSIDSQYGIGCNVVDGVPTFDTLKDGAIDEVTFYNGLKFRGFFQENLDRIVSEVPEPESLMLICTAFISLLAHRWLKSKKNDLKARMAL